MNIAELHQFAMIWKNNTRSLQGFGFKRGRRDKNIVGVTVDIYPSSSDNEGEQEEDKGHSKVDDEESREDDNCVE